MQLLFVSLQLRYPFDLFCPQSRPSPDRCFSHWSRLYNGLHRTPQIQPPLQTHHQILLAIPAVPENVAHF